MKSLLIAVLLFLSVGPALSLTPAEREIVKYVQTLNVRQKKELDDTKAKLVWVDKELKDTQSKIDQLGIERDEWKRLYEKDHETVLKQEATILKLWMAIIGLGLGLIVMIAWKFKLYRFIPGLGLAP